MNPALNKEKSTSLEERDVVLGVEFGSTRIKAVLTGLDHKVIAAGSHAWENSLDNGLWTYPLEEVWAGIQSTYAALRTDVHARYGVGLSNVKAIGISGMMHGYMVFDAEGNQLVPFRTWRNNITGRAAEELTRLFDYPIPQRWSIAHLYQAILNKEEHVARIAHATTLAGYVHWKLTGQKVMGIGEASGMFPIDIATKNFDPECVASFDANIKRLGVPWKLMEILPKVLMAGEPAGTLTKEGAALLDPSGELQPGAPLCPPEGDAGTGMVATNSVEVRTGNVSAGTSVFAMVVLEKNLSRAHHEIDLVTTPDGNLVGMVHSNNCSSDLDAWITLLGEAASALGADISTYQLYDTLLQKALDGDADCGGLLAYGYVSGEHIMGFSEGRPLFVRMPTAALTLANFMRTHLYTALCALRTGLDILVNEEGVRVDEIRGHGGFFKSGNVGRRIMAAATQVPVSVLETAGEGGAWGIALLASYLVNRGEKETLAEFLKKVFAESTSQALAPQPEDVDGFNRYFERYHRGLPIERTAVDCLH
jgi:sugar (pentulose or hexulose) kinase